MTDESAVTPEGAADQGQEHDRDEGQEQEHAPSPVDVARLHQATRTRTETPQERRARERRDALARVAELDRADAAEGVVTTPPDKVLHLACGTRVETSGAAPTRHHHDDDHDPGGCRVTDWDALTG